MNKRTAASLLGACVSTAALALPAQAQRVSPMPAGRFMQLCTSSSRGGVEICDAYITGMADSFALMQKLRGGSGGNPSGQGVCVPGDTAGSEMRRRVVAWARGHRDRMRGQVGEVVYQALHDSFPCGGG